MFRQGERTALKDQNAVVIRLDRRPGRPAPLEDILSERQTKRSSADDDHVEGATCLCLVEGVADISTKNIVRKARILRGDGHDKLPSLIR
jgi:hypothetical protein